ncbi:hypothetical protein LTS18_006807 [Coniosporium uncinatum]|uniref:Uncharacterized protein n=1 Tax=Coniosporium uncinatum TaxID=93489 RepID=A0ACC3DPV5_9PEZI|nr:hypothetical protein LTS18_006807 [Coniosporium uncinatum]
MPPKNARPSAPAVSAASTTPYKTTTSASGSAPRVAKNPGSTSGGLSSSSSSFPSSSSSSSTKSGNSNAGLDEAQQIVNGIWDNYVKKTPQRTKLIDAFMAFLVVVGALQFVYCVIVGNFVSSLSVLLSVFFLFLAERQLVGFEEEEKERRGGKKESAVEKLGVFFAGE